MALIADWGADLADGVDKLDTEHPLGGGQFHLTSKVVDVPDEGAQDDASALRGVLAHGIDDIVGEVGVEAWVGRHFGWYVWRGQMKLRGCRKALFRIIDEEMGGEEKKLLMVKKTRESRQTRE